MTKQRTTFGPVDVVFDDDCVLAPRPWTLLQSAMAVDRARTGTPGTILELHSGAGHIGQAVAAWLQRSIVQVDDDPACCGWSVDNAARNGIRSLVVCASTNALPVPPTSCALVIADPPYVPSSETARYPEDPLHSIDGGADGLDGVRATLTAVAPLLRREGRLLMQVRGPAQAESASALAAIVQPELRAVGVAIAADDRAVVEFLRT
jgi:methylase of polypeptide subunit release factors